MSLGASEPQMGDFLDKSMFIYKTLSHVLKVKPQKPM
jgi:hypothetical protein